MKLEARKHVVRVIKRSLVYKHKMIVPWKAINLIAIASFLAGLKLLSSHRRLVLAKESAAHLLSFFIFPLH
jgi:hypothetical protein